MNSEWDTLHDIARRNVHYFLRLFSQSTLETIVRDKPEVERWNKKRDTWS